MQYPLCARMTMRWALVFLVSLFFFYDFMQLAMLNVLNVPLQKALKTDAAGLGDIASYFFLAVVLFLIPAGALLDRCAARSIILFGLAVSVLGTFLFSYSTSLSFAQITRFITGFAHALCLMSCLQFCATWFSANKMARVSGIVISMGMLGGWVAHWFFPVLLSHGSWQLTVRVDAGLGVIFWGLIFLFAKEGPIKKVKKQRLISLYFAFKMVLGNRNNWLAGAYIALLNLPIAVIGSLWGARYLQVSDGLSATSADHISGLIFLGTLVGSPLWGYYSDRLGTRKRPMFLATFCCIINLMLILFYPGLSVFSLEALFFSLGFMSSVQAIGYPLIMEQNPKTVSGLALGVSSVIIMAGFGFADELFSRLLVIFSASPHTTHYTAKDFQLSFLGIMVGFVLALIVISLLRETYCRAVEH